MRIPWPHQLQYGQMLRNNEIRALWWQMRTGKTLTAVIGTDDGDRLIVCPNSVKGVWQSELEEYGQEAYIWDKRPPKKRPRNVIVNYEMVWRTDLLKWNWDSIIFDESLRLQNMRTKLWEGIQKAWKEIHSARRVICLTGTPCPEGFHQLITQSLIMSGQYCGEIDCWEALRKFFVYDDEKYAWNINAGHASEAKEQLYALGPIMSQQDAGIMTRKLYRTIKIELTEEEKKAWEGLDKSDMSGATLALYAQSYASGRPIEGPIVMSSKLDAVAEFAKDYDGQSVIMCRFTESLKYLRLKLPMAECVFGDDGGNREKIFQKFSERTLKILIANVGVVQVGINLSAASALIFAENSFSGATRIQAEERATVQGKNIVEIIDFITHTDEADLLSLIDTMVLVTVREKKDFNYKLLSKKWRH